MNEIRDGHYTLGIAYLNAERYAEAIPHFQQAVALDAAFIDGYHALALAHFGEHRLQDAKAAALEALKIDTTHAPTLSFLQALDPGASTLPEVSVVPTEPPEVVAEHLGQMVDAYKTSDIDYQLGLSHFNMGSGNPQKNNISVFQLTQDLSRYKRRLYEIRPTGDENALDAISETVGQLRFRTDTIKHLILVTDEPFTSLQGHTAESIITLCQRNELFVNVLGLPIDAHKRLASETGGSWHAVPQDPIQQRTPSRPVTPQTIGDRILDDAANTPVDVILFIDSSKSMEDKVAYITQQIDLWIRNWENANIDYRIGVIRFRAEQSLNIVNVFKPPQTQAQIHKILQLPCQEDENLLHAVVEGERRLKQRQNAKTHFILMTDEPGTQKHPSQARSDYSRNSPSSSRSSVRPIPFNKLSLRRPAVCLSECRMHTRAAPPMSDAIHRSATLVETIT